MHEGYCEEKRLVGCSEFIMYISCARTKLASIMMSINYASLFSNAASLLIMIYKRCIISSFEIKCFDGRSSHSFQITGISQSFFTHFFMMAFSSHATHAEF